MVAVGLVWVNSYPAFCFNYCPAVTPVFNCEQVDHFQSIVSGSKSKYHVVQFRVVAELSRKAIYENAQTALNQSEWSESFTQDLVQTLSLPATTSCIIE